LRMLYDISIALYRMSVGLVSFAYPKARAWIDGRKGLFERLQESFPEGPGPAIWIHCASLGEFEQGRPLLEALGKRLPGCRILLTFFSPSGYESRKNHPDADHVEYLPLDTPGNANRFLDIVKPDLAVFVKYEFWHHFLRGLKSRGVPTLLVSAIFRPSQPFFKPYGAFWRGMLDAYDRIFVQDEASMDLLTGLGLRDRVEVAGDTRFDRVISVANSAQGVARVESFCRGSQVLVAGSTWPEDEALLAAYASGHPDLRLVIAPHEVDEVHIASLQRRFMDAARLSTLPDDASHSEVRILIVDGIGLLSRLYRYADIAYIGGGFKRSGIHNILEAAVYGKPVFFGPNHGKAREAGELMAAGGGFAVRDVTELRRLADPLLADSDALREAGDICRDYVERGGGATERILGYVERKRLLTRETN
jgi:3-deoxy-D-manno-octulosonic-acid transferase